MYLDPVVSCFISVLLDLEFVVLDRLCRRLEPGKYLSLMILHIQFLRRQRFGEEDLGDVVAGEGCSSSNQRIHRLDGDAILFSRLRQLRKLINCGVNIFGFVIFHLIPESSDWFMKIKILNLLYLTAGLTPAIETL